MSQFEPVSLSSLIMDATSLMAAACDNHAPVALASSLSVEDMVLLDIIQGAGLPVEIFTLDTGRLHQETYALISHITKRYAVRIKTYSPDTHELESFTSKNGPDAFYDGLDLRLRCCEIRKVGPLRRALTDKGAWITGQRRQQSVTRNTLQLSEWDAQFSLQKFNPLAFWSRTEIWDYIRMFDVPYNALHDLGYASIGCAPCTRAITVGEDERAGRWWWESDEIKECGLHKSQQLETASAGQQEKVV